MSNIRLDQHRADTLKPRKKAYDIRDGELKGFGLRVLPSGKKRYFVHSQHRGQRIWKNIGDGGVMSEPEARARAASVLASIRNGEQGVGVLPEQTVFEVVAEEVFRRYQRNWKPGTIKVNRGYYNNQLLPWFGGKQIAGITRRDVRQWFASLHATPAAADRAAPVLSVIFSQAERYGYRPADTNPCKGIKRYRRRGRERFLSPEEWRRLSTVLTRHEADRALHAALVRLLLLTGCRKGEFLTLRWSCYREGKLFLPDSKTGARTVWLCAAARGVLDGLPRTASWVFPTRQGNRPLPSIDRFWQRVRAEADLHDVRLHDLRHSYASIALRRGETLLTIGKLLGHNDPATTLKYTHLVEAQVREAADALASVLGEAG